MMTRNSEEMGLVAVAGVGADIEIQLVRVLVERGARVHYISLEEGMPLLRDNVERYEFDEEGMERALEGCNVLFNLAVMGTERKVSDEERWRFCVDGTHALLMCALRSGVGHVVQLRYVLEKRKSKGNEIKERCLFRQEMEAWQGAERGLKVTTVAVDEENVCGIAEGLIAALGEDMVGKRLMMRNGELHSISMEKSAKS